MQLKLKMEVVKDIKNDLLKRREVKVIIHNSGNPGFAGAEKVVDEKFKANPEVTIINNVKSKFGRDTFLIDAFIYDSVEDKNRLHVIEEKKEEESAQASTSPSAEITKEEKKEEKPVEEKVEEVKGEKQDGS